ncbi:MAG: YicC family protein [Candidatus Omnitrophica bacterium]|nr:YicC family protein [Candidatus Omnitrophota bacterium]
MIKGMTGFGSADISFGKIKGGIEIKSQNHRYFDIVYYLPPGMSALEGLVRDFVNGQLERGRIMVSLKITDKPLQNISFNKDAVREYLRYTKILKTDFDLSGELKVSDLIRLPGVVEAREVVLEADEIWPAVKKGLDVALKSLVAMRVREGKALSKDMADILKRMTAEIKKIDARTKAILRDKKKTLSKEEFLSLQKGNDISEELTRLAHYIEEFKKHLQASGGVGKKLDFVAQEMQRETNTIGSKVQDRDVSNAVIALKSKIEKLREQAQNIE